MTDKLPLPKGAQDRRGVQEHRRKFGRLFLKDFRDHWLQHGMVALDRCAEEFPEVYVRIAASLVPRDSEAKEFGTALGESIIGEMEAAAQRARLVEGTAEPVETPENGGFLTATVVELVNRDVTDEELLEKVAQARRRIAEEEGPENGDR